MGVEGLALPEIQRGDRRRVYAALARNPRPVARRRELDQRDLAALRGGRAIDKREEVLILLGSMQLQYCVETVQYAAKLRNIRVIDPIRFDVFEQLAEHTDLVLDLNVGPAHRGSEAPLARDSTQLRIEFALFSLLVGQDLGGKHFILVSYCGEGRSGLHGA